MAPTVRVLDINPGSDGDGRKWPKHHYQRNDEYFKERIATDKWIKDLPGGPDQDVIYRLNRLPQGYAGFEKARADSKHVDRYIYGHPNGQFRSLNEFYPHFKHLMDYGGPAGCTCLKCLGGNGKKKKAVAKGQGGSEESTTLPRQSHYFSHSGPAQDSDAPLPNLISPFVAKSRKRHSKSGRPRSESPPPRKRSLVDYEGIPDIYETLLGQLKHGDRENVVDIRLEELMSPDWRSSQEISRQLFREWRDLPRYVPRVGEIVLFVRKLDNGTTIAWDTSTRTFRCMNGARTLWLQQPKWEAGVVTQMPQEAVLDEDLLTDQGKVQGVNYSGFRIEPLSEPGSQSKPFAKQHKHVPLHVVRPFAYWRDCLNGVPEQDWHPTIKHALTISSSFCVVGRDRFRGKWPNATVFVSGLYIGAELIMLGDTVRLLPRSREQDSDTITDVMNITAIRLRFVNMDLEENDVAPDDVQPYQTCLHVSGRVYTLDPTRSFDGVGKIPIDSDILPTGLKRYGHWYHYSDPSQAKMKIEVPYTRIVGRCFEDTAIDAWFGNQPDTQPNLVSEAWGKAPMVTKEADSEISRGRGAVLEARRFSQQTDKRIKSQEGRTWFWADTRIEQLDLQEVNSRSVGIKDERRGVDEMRKWRTALKALSGKKGALEEYHAVRKAQAAENSTAASSSAYSMVAASRLMGTESPSANDTEAQDTEAQDTEAQDTEAQDTEAQDTEAQDTEAQDTEAPDAGNVYDDEDAMDVDDEEVEAVEGSPSSGAMDGGEISQPKGDTVQLQRQQIPRSTPAAMERGGISKGKISKPKAITLPRQIQTISLLSSDEEDEDYVAMKELAKNIRPNDPRLR